TVRRGPYGVYVQQGEASDDKKAPKPRRTSLPRGMDGAEITLEQALALLALPRLIGMHPEMGEPIQAGIGRFGPYVRMGAVYGSLDRDDDVLNVGINRAVDLLAKKMANVRTVGTHPTDGQPVAVRKGRFGPYVQHASTVANLPRGATMEDVTLPEALALLAEKGKTLKPRGGSARKQRSGAAKAKAPAKETAKAAPAKRTKARKQPAKRKAARKRPAARRDAAE
ncbi:MAG: topoisomerase C-terminal repeat-containing protein, partial [Acetobacteraceae bacterium]